MVARLTKAQARALGLESEGATTRTRVRKTAKGPYHTICVACGTEFHTTAAEDRHVDDTHHARYRLVLGWTS